MNPHSALAGNTVITDLYEVNIDGIGVWCSFSYVREGGRFADLEVHDIEEAWLGGPVLDDAIEIGSGDEWSELFPLRDHLANWNVPIDVSRSTAQSVAWTNAIRRRIEGADYALAKVCERES